MRYVGSLQDVEYLKNRLQAEIDAAWPLDTPCPLEVWIRTKVTWCATCGKDTDRGASTCPECMKWWEDNMPRFMHPEYPSEGPMEKKEDLQAIDPRHYQSMKPEPIEVIDAWMLDFYLGNALAYIARADKKGSKKADLIKAANYCYRAATGRWLPKELQD